MFFVVAPLYIIAVNVFFLKNSLIVYFIWGTDGEVLLKQTVAI